MYVAHYAFYVACILRGCDMSTVFIRMDGYGYVSEMLSLGTAL